MDLIDREALQDKIWDIRTEIDSGLMLTIINHMPTVDAEPVRHGKWIEKEKDGFLHCSNCGYVRIGIPIMFNFEYCPKCGAKMG